jgi:hypothetical protein
MWIWIRIRNTGISIYFAILDPGRVSNTDPEPDANMKLAKNFTFFTNLIPVGICSKMYLYLLWYGTLCLKKRETKKINTIFFLSSV